MLATLSEARRRRAKWEVSGGVDYSRDSGWAGRVGLKVSWRRKRRSTKEQVFDVMMYMVNTDTGSRFRLNPCDFALYDQDDDLAVTMADFDILFSDMDKTKHVLVEQLFKELDVDNDQKISLMEFEKKRALVFSKSTCVSNAV